MTASLMKLGITFSFFLLGSCKPPKIPPPRPCLKDMCFQVPGYPSAAIDNAVRRSENFSKLLGPSGKLPTCLTKPRAAPDPLTSRQQPERLSSRANFEQACEVTPVVTEYPQTAKNVNKETRYVVNTREFRQPVSTEKCRYENKACNNLIKYIDSNVKTACRTRSVTVNLIIYDEMSDSLGTDQFTFPAACVCYYMPVD